MIPCVIVHQTTIIGNASAKQSISISDVTNWIVFTEPNEFSNFITAKNIHNEPDARGALRQFECNNLTANIGNIQIQNADKIDVNVKSTIFSPMCLRYVFETL